MKALSYIFIILTLVGCSFIKEETDYTNKKELCKVICLERFSERRELGSCGFIYREREINKKCSEWVSEN